MLLWAVLAGAVVLALLCGVLGWILLNVLRRMTLKSLPLRGGQPPVTSAVVNVKPAFGIFALLYAAGTAAGVAW